MSIIHGPLSEPEPNLSVNSILSSDNPLQSISFSLPEPLAFLILNFHSLGLSSASDSIYWKPATLGCFSTSSC